MADFTFTINLNTRSIGIRRFQKDVKTAQGESVRRGTRLFGILSDAIAPIIKDTARDIKDEIHYLMQLPKTGRIYSRKIGLHQASAPGEAPAIEEGTLFDSVQVVTETKLKSSVVADTPYTFALEFGKRFKKGRVLLPRPFMRPAVFEVTRQTPGIIGRRRGGAR